MTGPTRPVSPPEPLGGPPKWRGVIAAWRAYSDRYAAGDPPDEGTDIREAFAAGWDARAQDKTGGLTDYQRGYADGFDAPANVAARAQDETGLDPEALERVTALHHESLHSRSVGWRDCDWSICTVAHRALATTSAPDSGAEERLRAAIERFASERRLQWSDDDIRDLAASLSGGSVDEEAQGDDERPLDRLLGAVRDWVQFGAGDGTETAAVDEYRLLGRIAAEYARLSPQGGSERSGG